VPGIPNLREGLRIVTGCLEIDMVGARMVPIAREYKHFKSNPDLNLPRRADMPDLFRQREPVHWYNRTPRETAWPAPWRVRSPDAWVAASSPPATWAECAALTRHADDYDPTVLKMVLLWLAGCITVALPGRQLGQRLSQQRTKSEVASPVVFGEQVQSDGDIRNYATWRKSSWSASNGNCVEVAALRPNLVGVRDSKEAGQGPVLVFDSAAWRSFIGSVKSGG